MFFITVVFMGAQRVLWTYFYIKYNNWLLPLVIEFFPIANKINTFINRNVFPPSCVNEICPMYLVSGAVYLLNCRKQRILKEMDLNWVWALNVPLHLDHILKTFVPHNLISAQHSPVPLPEFQMATRFKTLMSSEFKNLTQIYYPFLS